MASLTFKTMSSATPAYLSDLIQTADPVRPLRSSDTPLLTVPRTRSERARRAFSVAASRAWNSLPSDIRSCRTVDTFKRHLYRPTCSDSLNLMPPVPLYLRTLRRYTNPILLFIIITNFRGETFRFPCHHCDKNFSGVPLLEDFRVDDISAKPSSRLSA